LPPDALDQVPEGPGVYRFYGENPLPIYIGKSRNLRERVAAHFTGDWRRETDLRLSQEIRRIEIEETAGEFGALLREAVAIKAELPAHNRALRRKQDAGVLALASDGMPRFMRASAIEPVELSGYYGPFTSKAGARETLRALACEHALCWRRLGLEKRAGGPCFQRQLKRCAGVCVGAETPDQHDTRLAQALARYAIPRWPLAGPALVREQAGERTDVHLVHHWCWLGTARDDGELGRLLDAPPHPRFDIDVARLLQRQWAKGSLRLIAVPYTATAPEPYEGLTTS
jgi:DNA polymerase-3 subunit epsilon